MLDQLPLDEKLVVAREWFRRAQIGEFSLDAPEANRFAHLLDCCQSQARMMAVQAHIDAGRIVVLDMRLRLLGVAVPALDDLLVPANDEALWPASGGRP